MGHVKFFQVPFNGCGSRDVGFGEVVLFVYGVEMGDLQGCCAVVVLGYVVYCGYCGGVFASSHEEFGGFVEVEDEEAEDEHDQCKAAHANC